MGGGPSGIVYGLQVPPQALVPAPGVGLSHAGGGKVRAGGLPLLGGVPAGTAVLPARRSRPHHVFCVRFGLRFGLKLVRVRHTKGGRKQYLQLKDGALGAYSHPDAGGGREHVGARGNSCDRGVMSNE